MVEEHDSDRKEPQKIDPKPAGKAKGTANVVASRFKRKPKE
ncbi:hypothetical protein [uncultured Methanoculleus sp.]|jgi:hypothetical protein